MKKTWLTRSPKRYQILVCSVTMCYYTLMLLIFLLFLSWSSFQVFAMCVEIRDKFLCTIHELCVSLFGLLVVGCWLVGLLACCVIFWSTDPIAQILSDLYFSKGQQQEVKHARDTSWHPTSVSCSGWQSHTYQIYLWCVMKSEETWSCQIKAFYLDAKLRDDVNIFGNLKFV